MEVTHWRHVLEKDIETLVLSCVSFWSPACQEVSSFLCHIFPPCFGGLAAGSKAIELMDNELKTLKP
jgi:hypothetical protein